MSSPGPDIGWWLNKVIMISSAFLLGAFFDHWIVDFGMMWSSNVSERALQTSLAYYHHLLRAPSFYVASLFGLVSLAILSCILKLILNPLKGMLFDGATLMLLLSGVSVYLSNFRAALDYLPAEGASAAVVDSFKTKDALLTLASSNMIIAVSLTGVLALQGAQGFSDRSPPAAVEPVPEKKDA
ncbi:Shr3 amino acid permease chaperone [Leucosporidium creatinivorum]|uniref:Shr3 amino acid permease chaperone n=1 Tax=Leucosporidium creatinivorum TaxID=106004 RepID=A0A1Y2FXQ1_9BASI|nr:Shr3 amino acid permease chaperone [Leucosporidium creatinivorum]